MCRELLRNRSCFLVPTPFFMEVKQNSALLWLQIAEQNICFLSDDSCLSCWLYPDGTCTGWNMHRNGSVLEMLFLVRVEVFTAVTMKNGVFWDVTPCGSEPHGVTSQKTPFFSSLLSQSKGSCAGCIPRLMRDPSARDIDSEVIYHRLCLVSSGKEKAYVTLGR
jgi:hypothetical protein